MLFRPLGNGVAEQRQPFHPRFFLETYMEKKIRQLRSVERPTWYRPYGDEEPFDLGELCHEIAALMERQNDEKVQESVSGELKQ